MPSASANSSPKQGGHISTRRRVTELPTSGSNSNCSSSCNLNCYYNDEQTDNPGYVPYGSSSSGQHIRYLLLLLHRNLLCSWLCVDNTCHHHAVNMVPGLRSGRDMWRKILGVVLLMISISVFFKVTFLCSRVEINGKWKNETGQLILQAFKDDWTLAQRAVAETQRSVPKRVLERVSVS